MIRGKVFSAAYAILLCVQLFPAALHADEASRRASAEELFTLIHPEKLIEQMLSQANEQTTQMMSQMFPNLQLTERQKKEQADFQARVMALIKDSLSWESIKPDYIKLYADSFTDEELTGIIGFYKSPPGHAMLEKTPDLLKSANVMMSARMHEVTPKLRQMMEDFQKQAAAEQNSSPPSNK